MSSLIQTLRMQNTLLKAVRFSMCHVPLSPTLIVLNFLPMMYVSNKTAPFSQSVLLPKNSYSSWLALMEGKFVVFCLAVWQVSFVSLQCRLSLMHSLRIICSHHCRETSLALNLKILIHNRLWSVLSDKLFTFCSRHLIYILPVFCLLLLSYSELVLQGSLV